MESGTSSRWRFGEDGGRWQDVRKGVVVRAAGGEASADGLLFRAVIPGHGQWSIRATVTPVSDDTNPGSSLLGTHPDALSPRDRRQQSWVASIPPVRIGNPSIERIVARSYADIGPLRIVDPLNPDRMVVAAGAPWFMALFGRDSLLASFMAMPINPPARSGHASDPRRVAGQCGGLID